MKKSYNIVLVDDHALFREALKYILNQNACFKVIAEASNGKEFLEILGNCTADLALVDISMPLMNGIDATREAIKKYPELKVIALSMHNDEAYYYKMLEAGAHGFVSKEAGGTELIEAIFMVLNGENYYSNQVLCKIIKDFFQKGEPKQVDDKKEVKLSKRENEVLKLICNGYSNNEIALMLGISRRTIEGHRSNLLCKTGAKNSIHLVLYGKEYLGLID
jgi:DNA-binding NarL/FixJ family response regulator